MHQVLGLPKLEILDISKNAIESIPEDVKKLVNLKLLAVSSNKITRLPMSIGDMNLVKLKFEDNPIEFPPLDALKPPLDRVVDPDQDKEICTQVKRFMRHAALRERLMTHSEEDPRYLVLWFSIQYVANPVFTVRQQWRPHDLRNEALLAEDFRSSRVSAASRISMMRS